MVFSLKMFNRFFNFRNHLLLGNSSLLKPFSLSSKLIAENNACSNTSATELKNNVNNYDYKNVFKHVDNCIESLNKSRLFAVVHLCGKQYKITTGDIIVVEGYWPPTVSDQIRLEKVLLVGGVDFTLFGTPILKHDLVNVLATVVEKTLTHTKTHFKKKRRKQYTRINFQRSPATMIRINSIEMANGVNESKSDRNSYMETF